MFAAQHLSYQETNAFSKIVTDYLNGSPQLESFYSFPPSIDGIKKAIKIREQHPTNRKLLVEVLRKQYNDVAITDKVKNNLEALLYEKTLTITTAHQPNLFTGPLYFIYKIIHAIKLSAFLEAEFPENRFVPVYYMGSEDADFAELNHTYVDGKRIEWNKAQGGAVGRMVVDASLLSLIDELEGQLTVEKFGSEIIGLLRRCYKEGTTIQSATFQLVNQLYGDYGLIVLIPDHPALKREMLSVFREDIFQNKFSGIVKATSEKLEKNYEAQAYPREINLFYLKDQLRERIEKKGERFNVLNTDLSFSSSELEAELEDHPERFSPNVVLRGLFQETILPNLAFIGGGGELAYWLQLKDVFEACKTPFPVLVLRNSFLVIENKWRGKIERLGLDLKEIFASSNDIMTTIVQRRSDNPTSLNGNFEMADSLFHSIAQQATQIDPTLSKHVAAIRSRSLKNLQELEKKMLRAEKRKFSEQEGQVLRMKNALFPNKGLQERIENISGFYAKWGKEFLSELYKHSPALEQQFTVLVEQP